MRRKSSAAADQVDPRDLIERVAAEHSSPSVPSPRAGRSASAAVPATDLLDGPVTASGRHRRAQADDDTGAAAADSPTGVADQATDAPVLVTAGSRAATTPADDASPWGPRPPAAGTDLFTPPGGDRLLGGSPGPDEPDTGATRSGRRIRAISGAGIAGLHGAPDRDAPDRDAADHDPADRTAAGRGLVDRTAVAEQVDGPGRAALEPGSTDPGLPDGSVVEIDRTGAPHRSAVRRFAPLGVGAAALLAATMIGTLLQPGADDPALSTTLVDASRRSVSDAPGSAASGVGDGGGSRLGDAAQGASGQIGPAIAAADAAERRAEERREQAASESASDSGAGSSSSSDSDSAAGSDSASGSDSSAGSGATGGVAGAAQVAGEGIQAALAKGWQAIGGDEFTGSSLGENWTAYDGPGHDGNGRRTPDAVSVENDNLVIRGDSEGNTGGIAWGEPAKYGKWEMRAKFPAGDKQYHPVLLLWPSEVSWPEGGEIDFAETTSASDDVSFFLHYGSDNSQKDAKKQIDITQWNNYAVEWTPDAVVGYVNGEEWFRSDDPDTLPPGPMHATIQLDYFPEGGSPEPSEMHVAWMRQYS